MKRFLFLLILLTGFVFQAHVQAQSYIVDEVIWVVGDDAIFLSDVESVRLDMQMSRQQISGDPYCFIPEQIAVQKLFLHQAKLDSIEVSDSEIFPLVDRYINNIISQYFVSQEKLEEYYNKPINAIREEIRNREKENNIIKQVQEKIVGKMKITPSDVRTFYKRIPQDSLPFIPTTVEVSIITLEPQIAIEEIDEIKERLREFTDQVNRGEMTFSALARMYSDDEGSAVRGGDLGFKGKSELVPEFAIAAFDLKDTRRISRVVQTEYGYHIIQLIEKKGDRINVRHILLREHISKEAIESSILRLDSIRNDIVDGKFTFEECAPYISADKDTKNNKGLMVNSPGPNDYTLRSGTSRFEMQELPPEIAKVINTMQIGDISKPFSMMNTKTNKEIVAIVKLKSRIEGHKASLSEDYQSLKSMVESLKQEEMLNKWIAKKQKETYIRINDNWKNCDFLHDGWIQK